MKFSIRDLLLVTVIVALAVGWWVDHRAQERLARLYRQRILAELMTRGAGDASVYLDAHAEELLALDRLLHSSAPAPNPPKQR